ncbi:sensor histidine kinase [Nonomuraea sp. NPDC050790]|uniref:sensor histidine kinase n=1 Tax=Nonomuraea sp. NPDC050790 TaxID=3364371 RepID=UPI00379A76C4
MISALVRPLTFALFTGRADPPPLATRRVRRPAPRWLVLLTTLDGVRLADLVLAIFLYGVASAELWARLYQKNLHPPATPTFQLAMLSVSLPLAMRDRWPMGAWRTALLTLPAHVFVDRMIDGFPEQGLTYTWPLMVSYLLVLYTVGSRNSESVSIAVWVVSVAFLAVVNLNAVPIAGAVLAVPLVLGYNVRARRKTSARLARESQLKVAAEGVQAALEERARIARELHDVVAHHMSVIAIQAEAVPLKAAGDARQLEEGLATIRSLSLDAIAQLRQVLGVLRDADGHKETTPQPGLERLGELVANARAAGLAVLFRQTSSVEEVPQAVGLSAYRIVQESLSNVMRHAPGATVSLEVRRERDDLVVRVANGPGPTPAESSSAGAGHGLVGMRERAALLGGTLTAEPVADGFEVVATLPLEPA